MVIVRFCFDVVYIELGTASRNLPLEKPVREGEYQTKQNRLRDQGQVGNFLEHYL